MIHEILLALSGHPSPFLQSPSSPSDFREPSFDTSSSFISPSEKALLGSLSHLSDLHRKVSSLSSSLASSHPSTICRAVSSAITSDHLAKFQARILEVERGILQRDAGSVGIGGVVPLSSIVSEFSPWTRRMEWLLQLVQFMEISEQPSLQRHKETSRSTTHACTGASLINHLREETRTGYPDLEQTALDLSGVAESAWLRQLSAWVLYGRLPTFGAEDFFIHPVQAGADEDNREFEANSALAPAFVAASTSSSILFIGKSLGQIRSRTGALSNLSLSSNSTAPELALLPTHHRHLSSITTPIEPITLGRAISAIRLSLSQNLLQRLLPLPKILEMLKLLKSFFLLGRGEFAMALIVEADAQLRSRWQTSSSRTQRRDKDDALSSVTIKEGELTSTMARTWTSLSSLQLGADLVDEELDLARDVIHLVLSKTSQSSIGDAQKEERKDIAPISFEDLLFPTPTGLALDISSPIDLVLSQQDLQIYSSINAYMLSIRRAHLRLTDLWKHTSLRRDHPAPIGPPHSNAGSGQKMVRSRRARAAARARKLRKVWATAGAAVFLLGEVGEYFQGDVVSGSWSHFSTWLEAASPGQATDSQLSEAKTSTSEPSSTPPSPSSNPPQGVFHDPETVSHAHQTYLSSLCYFLLMGDDEFMRLLHSFLVHVEQFIACVSRLESTWQHLDLRSEEGVVDAFADYDRDERRASREMEEIRKPVQDEIGGVVNRLGELDSERAGSGSNFRSRLEKGGYMPWRPAGVDRLLMKLDFGTFVESRSVDLEDEGEDEH